MIKAENGRVVSDGIGFNAVSTVAWFLYGKSEAFEVHIMNRVGCPYCIASIGSRSGMDESTIREFRESACPLVDSPDD